MPKIRILKDVDFAGHMDLNSGDIEISDLKHLPHELIHYLIYKLRLPKYFHHLWDFKDIMKAYSGVTKGLIQRHSKKPWSFSIFLSIWLNEVDEIYESIFEESLRNAGYRIVYVD